MEKYKLNFCGKFERELPIVETKNGVKIAGFDSVGDIELIEFAAKHLCRQLNLYKVDYILTTEVKGIPIAQEVAKLLRVDYVCLRKEPKVYLGETIKVNTGSITSGKGSYYLSKEVAEKLKNKVVVFIDDVYSTGETVNAVIKVCQKIGCYLTAAGFMLKELNLKTSPNLKLHFVHDYVDDCGDNAGIECVALDYLPLQ